MNSPEPFAGRSRAGDPPAANDPLDANGAGALAAAVETAVAHTNQGWAALERGEPQQAVQHFRRALRLRPNYARARSGIVEALKARHPLYRRLLGGSFWLARFQPSTQIAVMFAAFLALRLMTQVAAGSPGWAPILWPVSLGLFAVFVLLGLASPLFDVLLRLDPALQKSLDEDQRRGANLLLLNLLAPLPLLLWFLVTNNGLGMVVWILLTLTSLPSSAIYRCAPGWPRWLMISLTVSVLIVIMPLLVAALVHVPGWQNTQRMQWIETSVYALVGAQLAATLLLAFRGRH